MIAIIIDSPDASEWRATPLSDSILSSMVFINAVIDGGPLDPLDPLGPLGSLGSLSLLCPLDPHKNITKLAGLKQARELEIAYLCIIHKSSCLFVYYPQIFLFICAKNFACFSLFNHLEHARIFEFTWANLIPNFKNLTSSLKKISG
ncbi:hypothetical protein Glove_22g227 [Diversispora epigaea]|uniref:Uncharacterized protein n=1 Tax=Diversispora epigaea TaxID=1348612 RepID=A0A397JNS4_9GLOM|nr:hypothetical protein Glove_22g227 [Diversispora epigaea]